MAYDLPTEQLLNVAVRGGPFVRLARRRGGCVQAAGHDDQLIGGTYAYRGLIKQQVSIRYLVDCHRLAALLLLAIFGREPRDYGNQRRHSQAYR